jgi:hypothetical protein
MQSHTDFNPESPQGNLFDGRQPSPSSRLLARRSDPASSHAAAAEVIENGTHANQMAELLTWLREHPGDYTSLEISRLSGLDRYAVARRLPSLERAGLVERLPIRPCTITGRPSIPRRALYA